MTGRSIVQRSPTECGVSESDRATSQRPRPTRAVGPRGGEKKTFTGHCEMFYN